MLDIFEWMRNVASVPDGFKIVEFLFVLMLFGFAYAIFTRRRAKESKLRINHLSKEIEELEDNVNRLRSTVDLSPDTITVHRDGKLLFVNKAGLGLFGAESEELLIGLTMNDLLHYSYKEKVAKRLEEMVKYMKQVPVIDVTIKETRRNVYRRKRGINSGFVSLDTSCYNYPERYFGQEEKRGD